MASRTRTVALTGSDQQALTGQGIFRGVFAAETGGSSTAKILLYDGTSASGTLIGGISLAAGGTGDSEYADVWVETGIFVKKSGSGTVAGSVRIG